MTGQRQRWAMRGLAPAIICYLLAPLAAFGASDTWERLDKKLKTEVYQLNVGIKIHLKDGLWAQLSDLSPRSHYPVFSTTREDQGFRVVGFGSSFPLKSLKTDKTYFVTSRHVVDTAEPVIRECEKFYAGMRLYAEQTKNNQSVEERYKELLQIANFAIKKNMSATEKATYQTTVDAIWDAYDTYLSQRPDPGRIQFQKYLNQADVTSDIGYYLHAPGPVSQAALEAKLYRAARPENEPDLAILSVSKCSALPLEMDLAAPSEGQEIQVIGYPTASEELDAESAKYYAPTFSTGRISRVTPHLIQVDAPITTGNSGGPVVSTRGKVVGVMTRRAITSKGVELPNFAAAITLPLVRALAPELFGK